MSQIVLGLNAALALIIAVPTAAAQPSSPPSLSAENRAAVRCSAAFAIVAGEQARGDAAAMRYPPLLWRGREYMVHTGAGLAADGWTQAQVAEVMHAAAADLQREAREGGDAGAVLNAVMPPCLSLLDAEIAPLIKPNIAQCAAILRRSYDEIHAAEGLSARAKDMLTLATVLDTRARRELADQGRTEAEADAVMGLEAQSVAEELAKPGGAGRYDAATCFELAKPEKKTHY